MDILERDFKNENNDIVVDYSCREIKEIRLLGKEILFHPEFSCEAEEVIYKTQNLQRSILLKALPDDFLPSFALITAIRPAFFVFMA